MLWKGAYNEWWSSPVAHQWDIYGQYVASCFYWPLLRARKQIWRQHVGYNEWPGPRRRSSASVPDQECRLGHSTNWNRTLCEHNLEIWGESSLDDCRSQAPVPILTVLKGSSAFASLCFLESACAHCPKAFYNVRVIFWRRSSPPLHLSMPCCVL